MGIAVELRNDLAGLFRARNVTSWSGVSNYISGRAGFPDGKYTTYAREGYMGNALVYACIEELGTSAAEPELQALQAGRWIHRHEGSSSASRLLDLLYTPNDFMDKSMLIRNIVLHLALAGNSYALKVRTLSGRVVQLWLLRPDRVSIVPDAQNFISRYEYNIGDREPIRLPVEDVIHWKNPHPLDDFYGMPTLKALEAVVDLDNFSLSFAKTYFERSGVPAGVLTTKSKLTDDLKAEIKERFTREYGNGKWHGMLILDGNESTFEQLTQSLGNQGLVLPELNKIVEARIAGAFGVPLSLVGTVVGTEASSYGNKKSEREGFYNETIKPLWTTLMEPITRSLTKDFPGVLEVAVDQKTASALQEDDDKLHARLRADLAAGGISVEEFREGTGRLRDLPTGDTFYIPSNLTQTPSEDVGNLPAPTPALPAGTP